MSKRKIAFALVAVFGLGVGTGQVLSQEQEGDPNQPSQEEMQAWMAYMTPGKEHAEMAKMAGDWSVKMTMWSAPDAPPIESISSVKTEMILGGRYLTERWTGAMMGMPFEGFQLTGFDNQTKEFTSIWADSMGTGTGISKGKRGDDGQIHLTGEMVDPMGGIMKTRMILGETEDGSPTMEMFVTHPKHGEGEMKMMEMVYSRPDATPAEDE